MAKTTRECKTCKQTFRTATAERDHRATPEHRSAVEKENVHAEARATWNKAHRPAVTSRWPAVGFAGAYGGLNEHVAYALHSQNCALASDVAALLQAAERVKRDVATDVLDRVGRGGAAALYGGALASSAVANLTSAEGAVLARRDTLREFAGALGVRCEATYAPAEWAFNEALAQFAVEPQEGGGALLVSPLSGAQNFYGSEGEAMAEAVERARAVVEADPRFAAGKQ